MSIISIAAGYAARLANYALLLIAICSILALPASGAVVGGYAVSTTSHVIFVDGDGTTTFPAVSDTINNITGMSNGNVVGRIGADLWRLYDAEGNTVTSRQLDNSGVFSDARPLGGGGYGAVSNSHVIFMAADGDTVNSPVTDTITFATSLSNGNMVGYLGGDNWRLYAPSGATIKTRNLDNSGVFNDAAAVGNGGYVAISNSHLLFMAADGETVNGVITDTVVNATSLTNGNMVARIGADVWRLYGPNGNTIFTRQLDNVGTFAGAAAVGGGGYVAYTDSTAIFMAANGDSVNKVVNDPLEFVTTLNNGNVVGRLIGTDDWRLYDPLGNTLATRTLDNVGTFTGAAPTGLAFIPEPSTGLLATIAVPFIVKRIRRLRRQFASN